MPDAKPHHGTEERHAGFVADAEASYVQSSSGGDKARLKAPDSMSRHTDPIGSCLRRRNRKAAPINILRYKFDWKKVRGARVI